MILLSLRGMLTLLRLLTSSAAMRLPSILLFAAPLCAVYATPVPGDCPHKLKESIAPPRGWVQTRPAPSDHVIELRIALPQPNFGVLENHLYEVSDPAHARYGQHLSKEEVEAIIAPNDESVDAVNNWLQSHGLNDDELVRSPAQDWVTIRVPVSLAEKILDTVSRSAFPIKTIVANAYKKIKTYHVWTHEKSGDTLVRTLSYSVPENIHSHVELIQPTTMFARMKQHKTTFRFSGNSAEVPAAAFGEKITLPSGITVDASCNTTVTISCLKQLYNAVGFNASARVGNEIGITGYLGQFANIADLQLFFADQRTDAINSTFNVVSVNGMYILAST